MAAKKSSQEIRHEVLLLDEKRDVNFNFAVAIATLAILSSASASLAVLSLVFLSNFRKDVENMWMGCIPFCFTFVTGLALAYRKQMADVGVHIALALVTLLAGGAGYGLSVKPVYIDRHNCTKFHPTDGECVKEVLTTMYFVSGAVASGIAVIGVFLSLCACSNAMNRRAKRSKLREHQLFADERQKALESKQRTIQTSTPTVSATYPTSSPQTQGATANVGKPVDNGINGPQLNHNININTDNCVNVNNVSVSNDHHNINNNNNIPNGINSNSPPVPNDNEIKSTGRSHVEPEIAAAGSPQALTALNKEIIAKHNGVENMNEITNDLEKTIEDLNSALEKQTEHYDLSAPSQISQKSVDLEISTENKGDNDKHDNIVIMSSDSNGVDLNGVENTINREENGGTTTHL